MRIGTRGSALALAQAGWVAEQLGSDAELVTITTAGDRQPALGDKSRWVSALEQALIDQSIDLAVHSAKDVPSELGAGLELVAFPRRADPRDVICGAPSLDALAPGARVGTSSLRRAAQLRALRDDIEVVELRGNVDTRLRKLSGGDVQAIVLAAAGLARLGRASEVGGVLHSLVPAAGQGALAIEAIPGRVATERLEGLDDRASALCVLAERELTAALGASCNTPVGAHARMLDDGTLELRGWVGVPDGSAWIADVLEGAASEVGSAVAQRLLSAGADELLRRSEAEAPA